MESRRKFEWKVGELPFLWGSLQQPTNGDLPDKLPFELYVNGDTGILMQRPDTAVSAALAKAYSKGSQISGMMDHSGIGKDYADDFIDTIKKSISPESVSGKKVLEIGCGTGYLLSRLKEQGASVLGIEPGAHANEGSKRFNVPVINDFFPSNKIVDQFDIVLAYAVLEHMEEPFSFLSQIRKYLSHEGRIVLSVPNCEPYLRHGDISLLLHEHWSYFTKSTLKRVLINSGFKDVSVVEAGFGGAIYGTGIASASDYSKSLVDIDESILAAGKFKDFSERAARRLTEYFSIAAKSNRTIGVYVPGRIINIIINGNIPLDGCRFFDDNATLHGTYFPGIDIPIESGVKLLGDPTDQVLVMSRTFGQEIRRKLSSNLPKVQVTTWDEIFSESTF